MPNDARLVYRAERMATRSEKDWWNRRMVRFTWWLFRRAAPGQKPPDVRIQPDSERPKTYAKTYVIQFAPWAVTSVHWKSIAAHEIAHVIVRRKDMRIKHGPTWRREYLRVLRIYDRKLAKRMLEAFILCALRAEGGEDA